MLQNLTEWFQRRRALRELQSGEFGGGSAFRQYFSDELARARAACDNGDRGRASEIMRSQRKRFPDLILHSRKAFEVLIDLAQYDEVEELLGNGRKRFPYERKLYATMSALVACRRGDFEEALRRCADLRDKFSHEAEGYTIAVDCLRQVGRDDELEEMLKHCVTRIPDNFQIAVRYAELSMRRREWPEALNRWKALWDRFESQFLGPLGVAQCLREMERFDEAETILVEFHKRSDKHEWILAELAELAAARGDLDEADRRWERTTKLHPFFAHAFLRGAELKCRIGRDAEADAILTEAITRFRSNLQIHLAYARMGSHSGIDADALRRWALVHERFPDCSEASEQCSAACANGVESGRTAATV